MMTTTSLPIPPGCTRSDFYKLQNPRVQNGKITVDITSPSPGAPDRFGMGFYNGATYRLFETQDWKQALEQVLPALLRGYVYSIREAGMRDFDHHFANGDGTSSYTACPPSNGILIVVTFGYNGLKTDLAGFKAWKVTHENDTTQFEQVFPTNRTPSFCQAMEHVQVGDPVFGENQAGVGFTDPGAGYEISAHGSIVTTETYDANERNWAYALSTCLPTLLALHLLQDPIRGAGFTKLNPTGPVRRSIPPYNDERIYSRVTNFDFSKSQYFVVFTLVNKRTPGPGTDPVRSFHQNFLEIYRILHDPDSGQTGGFNIFHVASHVEGDHD